MRGFEPLTPYSPTAGALALWSAMVGSPWRFSRESVAPKDCPSAVERQQSLPGIGSWDLKADRTGASLSRPTEMRAAFLSAVRLAVLYAGSRGGPLGLQHRMDRPSVRRALEVSAAVLSPHSGGRDGAPAHTPHPQHKPATPAQAPLPHPHLTRLPRSSTPGQGAPFSGAPCAPPSRQTSCILATQFSCLDVSWPFRTLLMRSPAST